MPQTAPVESSTNSFAGLLASLAEPQKAPAPRWDDDLADDIATISYEQAVRSATRYQPLSFEPQPAPAEGIVATGSPGPQTSLEPAQSPSASTRDRRKTSSITIRLNEQECAQLRLRAAEAGLTVSAYLRSCTLEIESLRAQVKETLARLRQSSPRSAEPNVPAKPLQAAAPGNWRRIWPFGHSRRVKPVSPDTRC
jgi:hypothetical protein